MTADMTKLEKVTLNISIGGEKHDVEKAQALLEKITSKKSITTKAKKRIPTWGLRKGLPIGAKVTLRRKEASEFLKKCLDANDNTLKEQNFDDHGNFAFGIKEYIDLPGTKYDPEIGLLGFDVCVTLNKWGYRNQKRKIQKSKIPQRHRLTKNEGIEFAKKHFSIGVEA